MPVTAIGARHGGHRLSLVERANQGAPCRRIVERRVQLIESRESDRPGGVINLDRDAWIFLQKRELISIRCFQPIDLAAEQRANGGRGIADGYEFDPVEMHDLRTREHAGFAIAAWPVIREPFISGMLAGIEFRRQETE